MFVEEARTDAGEGRERAGTGTAQKTVFRAHSVRLRVSWVPQHATSSAKLGLAPAPARPSPHVSRVRQWLYRPPIVPTLGGHRHCPMQ